MLQFIFLTLFLCSQYAAGIPVSSSVYIQEADVSLRLHIVPATWPEAALLCQLEGGMLASPTTRALAEAMWTTMDDNKLSFNSVFIGVTDLISKGDYKSLDGAPVTDIPLEWAAGEPDNADNAENCLALTGAGTLADVSCSSVLPYFCRKESANNSNTGDESAPQPQVLPRNGKSDRKESANNSNTGDESILVPQPQVLPCNGKSDYEWEPRTGSCYKFHPVAKAWLPALNTCYDEGGYLAIINDQTESVVLKEIYERNAKEITGAWNIGYISIGFKKWAHDEWVTLHDETLTEAGFAEWSRGEPNNHGGVEDCGSIYLDGLLNDTPCDKKYSYICEITPLRGVDAPFVLEN